MSFVKGKPIKNLIYGLTHPLKMAREKPIMFLLAAGVGIYFIGGSTGWGEMGSILKALPFVK